jgi:uncharacterized protein YcbK (DUF882 family)
MNIPGTSRDRPPQDPFQVRVSRRVALRTLALAAAGGLTLVAAPGPAGAQGPARRIVFHNTHTLESLTVDYREGDEYAAPALAAVNQVLRDHRNGAVHAIDPALLDLLYATAARCGCNAEFEVISGYRSPESNAAMHARSPGVAEHSLHMQGRAIDVRLAGCDLARLRDAGLALGVGGVGYYPGPQFVHLDTGRVRSWVG